LQKKQMPNLVRQYAPSEWLKPFVFHYWEGVFNSDSGEPVQQKVLPNGGVELVVHRSDRRCELELGGQWVNSPGYSLIGLWSGPYRVRFRKRVEVFGIQFKPEGILPISGIPASEFVDDPADMEAVKGRDFRDLCHRLREIDSTPQRIQCVESFLEKQLRIKEPDRDYLAEAVGLIRREAGQISVEELSRQVFISRRQLEREFKANIGMSPKMYIRIARLNRAHRLLERDPSPNLAGLSYETGYADQAHFIREFKALTGVTSSEFVAGREVFI
jgi:AraC-like DNA-binding protein